MASVGKRMLKKHSAFDRPGSVGRAGGKLLSLFISHTGVQRAEMRWERGGGKHMQRRQGASRAIGINLRLRLRLAVSLCHAQLISFGLAFGGPKAERQWRFDVAQ